MRILIALIFVALICGNTNGQIKTENLVSIDHIPIVVNNLGNCKKILSELLHFRVKEGRKHKGIENCFIKFEDGTYLEFTTPIDSFQVMGKYYTDLLKVKQGGTSMAISIKNSTTLIDYLNTNYISYKIDSNSIWKTIEPKDTDIFFIEYSNKLWRDSKSNTTHLNTALSLKSTYVLSSNLMVDVEKYKLFGFSELKSGSFQNTPFKHLVLGNSNLYLLDAPKANKLKQSLNKQNLTGICGFEIKIKSLSKLNKLLKNTENVTLEKKQTIVYLQELNLFFVFTE